MGPILKQLRHWITYLVYGKAFCWFRDSSYKSLCHFLLSLGYKLVTIILCKKKQHTSGRTKRVGEEPLWSVGSRSLTAEIKGLWAIGLFSCHSVCQLTVISCGPHSVVPFSEQERVRLHITAPTLHPLSADPHHSHDFVSSETWIINEFEVCIGLRSRSWTSSLLCRGSLDLWHNLLRIAMHFMQITLIFMWKGLTPGREWRVLCCMTMEKDFEARY